MVDFSEQWKLKGLCKLCRRRKYCSKLCTAKKKRIGQAVKDVTLDTVFSIYGGDVYGNGKHKG